METGEQLDFLRNKIIQLDTALFTDFGFGALRFSSSIVTVLSIDDAANIWFTVPSTFQCQDCFTPSFFSQLLFYNKQFDYYIQIGGVSTIVEKNDSINTIEIANTKVLLRLHIQEAEYHFSSHYSHNVLVNYLKRIKNILVYDDQVPVIKFGFVTTAKHTWFG
jgi:hypothetical protein